MATQTIAVRAQAQGAQRQASIVFRQLRRNPTAVIGAALLALEIVVAVAAPLLAPYDPLDQDFTAALKAPSGAHLFGTDDVGRDLLSRVMYGARISLRVGLIAVAIGGGVGVVLGLLSGFYGGLVAGVILRFMDLLLAFPGLLLALAVVAVLGPGLFNVMLAVGVGGVPVYTRLTHASTLSVRERDYVLGARAVGCSDARIMCRYILPNVIPPVLVLATLGVAGAILTAAALSFIGLGAQPPTPEWGATLTLGRRYLQQAWWYTVFPGLALMVTVLAINMLGDALRDALDPKLRQ
ncbi:MAG TPA: ABC transporter permease [Thermomicrobiales bacterium]|nr:ABC transporter permease [Thermomicrobiales bacterium]